MRGLDRIAGKTAAQLLVLCGVLAMVGCGGGGGGGGSDGAGGSISLTLSPSPYSATVPAGGAGLPPVHAVINGTVSDRLYALILDPDGLLNPDFFIIPESPNTYRAEFSTSRNVVAGSYSGSFTVVLCADSACKREYTRRSLPYNITLTAPPAPRIVRTAPAGSVAGDSAKTITVDGNGFFPSSKVLWNGSPRPTTYVAGGRLQADIAAADLTTAGIVSLVVDNTSEWGGASSPVTYTVENLDAEMSRITPREAVAGSDPIIITIDGLHFLSDSIVQWNGQARPATFVSPTKLTVAIEAADVADGGNYEVRVSNPGPGGGGSALNFTVRNPIPTATGLEPASIVRGGPGFTLTINGEHFVPSSSLIWNGNPRPSKFISSTAVTTEVTADEIADDGRYRLSIKNPTPDGGTSDTLTFIVANPEPVLDALAPASVTAGANDMSIVVSGSGFDSTSTILWNGSAVPTIFISATQMKAKIAAKLIADGGRVAISVVTPAPGGGTSSAATFTIANPAPKLDLLNPRATAAGCGDFTLAAVGSGFVPSSMILFNGQPRVTAFESSNRITTALSAADIAVAGTADIQVRSPAPAGGSSSSRLLIVESTAPSTTDATDELGNPQHQRAATVACLNAFPAKESWRFDLGDVPHSTLIAQGRVFFSISSRIYALDAATGSLLWGPLQLGPANSADSFHLAYDAGRLYTVVGNAQVMALEPGTGAILWSQQPARLQPQGNNIDSNLVVADGRVYVRGAVLYALDATSGATLWTNSRQTNDRPSVDPTAVYLSCPDRVVALDPETGVELSSVLWSGERSLVGMAQLAGNYVYVRDNIVNGVVFDLVNGTHVADIYMDQFLVLGDRAYELQDGKLTAYGLGSNQQLWKTKAPESGFGLNPYAVNRYVFSGRLGNNSSTLWAFDGASGALDWSVTLESAAARSFTGGDGMLLVITTKGLVAYNLSSGR